MYVSLIREIVRKSTKHLRCEIYSVYPQTPSSQHLYRPQLNTLFKFLLLDKIIIDLPLYIIGDPFLANKLLKIAFNFSFFQPTGAKGFYSIILSDLYKRGKNVRQNRPVQTWQKCSPIRPVQTWQKCSSNRPVQT